MNKKFINSEFTNDVNLLKIMQIMRTRNIGPITFQKLFNQYKDFDRILNELSRVLSKNGNIHYLASLESVKHELEKTRNFDDKITANIISIFDSRYPSLLRECTDPPIIISYRGDIEKVSNNTIGFVGARNCSANGVSLAYKLAKDLVDSKLCVVSGLAKGIDTASHKGALESDKFSDKEIPTIGVIGGGIDNIYPKDNEALFERVARDGLIISEYPFGSKPRSENFPKRNRIISALSKGILVVEATLKSGSLITARMALEQNREIMCIPGFPMDERAKGCNKLIKEGAHIITNTQDIIDIISETKFDSFPPNGQLKFEESDLLDDGFENSFFDDKTFETEEDLNKSLKASKATIENVNILEFIGHSPTDIDEIAKISGASAAKINSDILEFEIEGKLTRHPGNKVSINS